jgi:hypothetical protein
MLFSSFFSGFCFLFPFRNIFWLMYVDEHSLSYIWSSPISAGSLFFLRSFRLCMYSYIDFIELCVSLLNLHMK